MRSRLASSWRAADGCGPAAATPSMHFIAARRNLSSSCRAADECTPQYVTPVTTLADASQDTECDVLYVVGGLYGNVKALEALEVGIERERRHGLRIEVCFNGDFNFFNATSKTWARINQGVRALGHATAGNVEREALNGDGGCGCAYPDYVDAAFADRASAIVERLRDVSTDPDIAAWLSSVPFAKTYVVGGVRVCCVHGFVRGVEIELDTRRWRRGGTDNNSQTQATRPARTAGPSTRPTCRAGRDRTARRTSPPLKGGSRKRERTSSLARTRAGPCSRNLGTAWSRTTAPRASATFVTIRAAS